MLKTNNKGYFSVVQMDCKEADISYNTDKIIYFINKISKENSNVDIIVFPEMCLYGYSRLNEIKEKYSQTDIMGYLEKILLVCKENNKKVILGGPFIKEEKVFNSLYLISYKKGIENVYSKMHLIDCEKKYFNKGTFYKILKFDFLKVGLLICWDSAFSEVSRLYAKAGADFIIISAAWEKTFKNQWEIAGKSNAFLNSIPIIASNRVGKDNGVAFAGNSMIIDSLGNVLEKCNDMDESYIISSIDFLDEKNKRIGFGSQINELREDTYNNKFLIVEGK